MEDNIGDIIRRREAHDSFMSWLRENHLEIFEKYADNFSLSFKPEGGITVNTNNNIDQVKYDELYRVANSYYVQRY